MIDPNAISTIRVEQLASAPFSLTDNIPHEVSGVLKKGTIQSLSDFIASVLGTSEAVGYYPLAVVDGQQLPEVPENPSFFLCGKGTFLNINGFDDLVCSEELNVIMSLSDHWEIAVQIPIDVDPVEIGISQTINSGVTNFAPSEDAVFNALHQFLNTVGSFHYADLASQTTPLTVVANVPLKLLNDAEGTQTNVSNAPYGVSVVWDETNNQIDLSALSVGDLVHLRIDTNLTTGTANQTYRFYANMAIGSGNEWTLDLMDSQKKTSGLVHSNAEVSFDIANEDTRDFPAEIYVVSDGGGTIKINGWYFEVIRKNINIVNFITDEAPIDGLVYGRKDAGWEEIISASATIVTKTKAEIDTLISGNDLVPLTVYEITGVDTALYGGSTIYLQAINDNILATDGYGKFFNPKYNQAVSGFEVWTSAGTYSIGDKVHWGGKTWENVAGNVGASTDLFTLDAEWSVIAFNDTDYNVAYDLIKYDYVNDNIVYRNELNSNIVSTNYDEINWNIGINPIKAFMWGNIFDYAVSKGIGNQIINNSYNENINFRGSFQIYLTFNNGSYQQNITFDNASYQQYLTFDHSGQDILTFDNASYQQYLTFDNNSYQQYLTFDNASYQQYLTFDHSGQQNITFDNASYQQYLTFDNNSYQYNLTFDNNSYQSSLTFYNTSGQYNLTFDNGSYQYNLTFDNTSGQYNLTFDNGSNQSNLTFYNTSGQHILTFDNGSYQYNLTFDNTSGQYNLTFDNGSNQSNLTFDNGSSQYYLTEITGLLQSKLSFNNYQFGRTSDPLIANEIGLMFKGTLPTSTTATKMIVAEDGQWKEMDVPTTTIAGSFSATGTATTTFTVTIGTTQADALYKVTATPSNVLSAVMFYINNKTTTTFDVVFVTGLTGAVAFDWILKP
jgi:hypothetical protein